MRPKHVYIGRGVIYYEINHAPPDAPSMYTLCLAMKTYIATRHKPCIHWVGPDLSLNFHLLDFRNIDYEDDPRGSPRDSHDGSTQNERLDVFLPTKKQTLYMFVFGKQQRKETFVYMYAQDKQDRSNVILCRIS